MKSWVDAADDPFLFSTGIDIFTGDAAWGRKGLREVLERAEVRSLEYHAKRGDLSTWARWSLGDADLAEMFEEAEGLSGEGLRAALLEAVNEAASRGRSEEKVGRGQKNADSKSGRKKR